MVAGCHSAVWRVLGVRGVLEHEEGVWQLGGRAGRGLGGVFGREQEAAEDGEARRPKGAI
jgi:hypothetical protein